MTEHGNRVALQDQISEIVHAEDTDEHYDRYWSDRVAERIVGKLDPLPHVRINDETALDRILELPVSGVLTRVENGIRMAVEAAMAARMEDHPASRAHLVWAFDEAPRIAQFVTTAKSWRELLDLVVEVDRLRENLSTCAGEDGYCPPLTVPSDAFSSIAQELSELKAENEILRSVVREARSLAEQWKQPESNGQFKFAAGELLTILAAADPAEVPR